jgi:DnaK suppressor protein
MAQKTSLKKPAKKTSAKKTGVKPKGSAAHSPKKTASPKKSANLEVKSDVKTGKRPSASVVVTRSDAPKEPKKEKAPSLSKQDLQYFRNLLLEKRREIIGDVGSMESEAFKSGSNLSNMPIHMADVGTDNFEQEFTLGLIESERQILREIQEALVRIDNGTYGICQGTSKAIPRVRLEAVPWAKYTIEYSRLLESGKLSQHSDADDDSGSSSDDDED